MKLDDCKYLKPKAHDGAWVMKCTICDDECNTNWEEYKKCWRYNNKENNNR